uniref:Uncharacterized protein n=1 Tax=Plectus sambesii TaxID=2011161 RepID=A0A914VK88_9BILA
MLANPSQRGSRHFRDVKRITSVVDQPYFKFRAALRRRRSPYRLNAKPDDGDNDISERLIVKKVASLQSLMAPVQKSPVAAAADMASELLKGEESGGGASWTKTFERVKELNEQMKSVQRVRDEVRNFDEMIKRRAFPYRDFAQEKLRSKVRSIGAGPLDDVMNVNALIDSFHVSQL